MYYTATGKFNPYIMPEYLFRTKIELKLNKQGFKEAWADKSYFDLFLPDAIFPKTYFRNVSGKFLDKDFNLCKKDYVISILGEIDKFVIKPTTDTGVGKGVQLVHSKDSNIGEILDSYKKDYIIQELFQQHEVMSSFNPSSVNVIRYISLLIGDEVVPLMAAMRCGAEGAFNDNSIDENGMGMFVVGINTDGTLKNVGYHSCGVSINKCPNGTEFSGVKIPGFEEMTEMVKKYHKKLAHFGFIGWDFVVNKKGDPVVMEYNIKSPGGIYYQYVNGPMFGDLTKELLNLCK